MPPRLASPNRALPYSPCGENGLDVAVVVGAAAGDRELRHDAVAVGRGAGDAAQRCLQLKLVDLVLHVRHAVARDGVEDLLRLRGGVGVDARGVERAIVVDAVDAAEDVAAALLLTRKALGRGSLQIAQLAEDVVIAVLDRGLVVIGSLTHGSDGLVVRLSGIHPELYSIYQAAKTISVGGDNIVI